MIKWVYSFITLVLFAFSTGTVTASQSGTTRSASFGQHTPVHQFNSRIRNQRLLIQKGYKAGKLTKEQAETLSADLKAARIQVIAFFKQNRNHNLTIDQQTQLNQKLNRNSAILGETPVY